MPQRLAVRHVAGPSSGTAMSGTTPVPCQFVPVTGLIDRANGIAICTAGADREAAGRVGAAAGRLADHHRAAQRLERVAEVLAA